MWSIKCNRLTVTVFIDFMHRVQTPYLRQIQPCTDQWHNQYKHVINVEPTVPGLLTASFPYISNTVLGVLVGEPV